MMNLHISLKLKPKYIFYLKTIVFISNKLEECSLPTVNQLIIKTEEKYHKQEFKLSDMEDIYENPLIYLYKIYYLGDELIPK